MRGHKKTGNTVKIVSTPNSATERLALYQQLLAAGAGDIDVFQIDVVWSGILGQHFVDLTPKTQNVIDQHFPTMIATSKVKGKLVALPWFADAGLLYYRKDLLEKHKRPDSANLVRPHADRTPCSGCRKTGREPRLLGIRVAGARL